MRTGWWVGRRQESRAAGRETLWGGGKHREIADALRVSERSVERWLRQWRERGEAGSAPGARRGAQGPARSISPGWNGSWNAVRWSTAGWTSGGLWPDHRH
ncbi:helix-turn-helix domain-containing protein [Streptomyces sp. NBC_00562]|nr:helix-turn-helix domain-containing protein [Streptomyces sp. NBC_00562]WUC23455.1 helix-turn-helix domain-containing protein [Streptomyces sp. NBC_00562]